MTERLAICWSYAARASDDADGAIRLLKNWYRFTIQRRCQRSGLRLALELATPVLTCATTRNAARHHVCEAIRMAAPHRWLRSFIDAGRPIHQLLQAPSVQRS